MKLMLALALGLLAGAQPVRAAQLAEMPFPVPVGAYPDDPADSLYTAARAALAEKRYERAADLFHEIRTEYPKSSYVSDAAYWEAFSRSRLGDVDNLRQAYQILSSSAAKLSKDAAALQIRVCSQLVQKGDKSCKQNIISQADQGKEPTDDTSKCPTEGDHDIRIDALEALMQMDPAQAMPILKQVLAKRDACSVELRRKAVFIVSQKAGSDAADILLETARTDPDQDVREQAVFWLSQVHNDPRAVAMLDSLLLHSDNEGIREKALFALSQQRERGSPFLRDFATRDGEPEELREKAIFWLSQTNNPDDEAWLRQQFRREKNEELKEKIIFAIAQHHDADNGEWILNVALDTTQSIEVRKKAMFWAGQGSATLEQLVSLYGKMQDTELKDALIFAFSQRHERGAIDELMTIAKTDKDAEARKKAVFWLGQSHDPRVTQFLSELINK